MTINIFAYFGRVEKSTITANLAGELVEKKLIVRVADLDPQQSLAFWARMGGGVLSDIVGTLNVRSPKEFKAIVEAASDEAERVILDFHETAVPVKGNVTSTVLRFSCNIENRFPGIANL